MITTGIWYAATDGYLHHTKTGAIGPQWDLDDLRLTRQQREALTIEEYIPNQYNTGLLYGTRKDDLIPVYPQGDNVHINMSPGVYENRIFWGEVRIPNNGVGGVVMRNCVLAGQDPETIASAIRTDNRDGQQKLFTYAEDSQPLRAWESNSYQWVAEDCLSNPGAWFDSAYDPPGGARIGNLSYKLRSSLGVRGGSGTLLRCRLQNSQDLITINQPSVDGSDPSFLHVKGCMLDSPLFYQGPDHWQAEGTHSDSIQFHRGKNIQIVGNLINVGANAGIMLQQEVSSAPENLIENVLIRGNVFVGGSGVGTGWGINHAEKYTNDYSTTQIYDNDFIARGDGKYIIARQKYLGSYDTNYVAVWDEPGVSLTRTGAVTIANGGA